MDEGIELIYHRIKRKLREKEEKEKDGEVSEVQERDGQE